MGFCKMANRLISNEIAEKINEIYLDFNSIAVSSIFWFGGKSVSFWKKKNTQNEKASFGCNFGI